MRKYDFKLAGPPRERRLPGHADPLTIAEQDDLFAKMPENPDNFCRNLLPSDVQNVYRMRATLQFYRRMLGSVAGLDVVDSLLPARESIGGIDYLDGTCCDCRNCQAVMPAGS